MVAWARARNGMTPSLVDRYARILEADPRSRIFVELARALLEAGDIPRAAQICERGLEHHPDSIQGRVLLGKALLRLGRTEEALKSLDNAIAADPGNPYGYDLVGEALVNGGLPARALTLMLRGAELHPGDGRIRRWLAEARQAAPPAPPGAERLVRPAAADGELSTTPASPANAPIEPAPQARESGAALPGPETIPPSQDLPDEVPEVEPGLDAAWDSELALPDSAEATAGNPSGESTPSTSAELGLGGAEALAKSPRSPLLTPPPLRREPREATDSSPAPSNELAAAASFLDLLPTPPPSAVSAPSAAPLRPPSSAEEAREADEAARTYEHALREELIVKPAEEAARPGFLRRHAGATALAVAVLLLVGGALVYLAVRAHRRADEARASVEAARKGLARDTAGALREALRVLSDARRALPHDPEAGALLAETSGLLAHDYGDEVSRALARDLVAKGEAGEVAARYLVGGTSAAAAAMALLDQAPAGKPFVRALAGELLLSRHDLEGAAFHLEAAARASPPLLRALCALGDLELARGDVKSALERYATVLKAHPTHPRAALGAAEARLRLGQDLPEALAALERVEADPQSPPPLGDRLRMDVLVSRLLAAVGRTAEAERRLSMASARFPESAELKFAEAEVLAAAGDLEGAARSAESAVHLAPSDTTYLELWARLQLKRGRYRELLAATESVASRNIRLDRGIARLELGEPDRARTELEATRHDGKMTAEAAGWMAIAELASGHREQAAALTSALLATANPHPLALVARGRLDLEDGRPEAAERRFREAVDRDPDLAMARCDLGRALLARGRGEEARDVLEKALARSPNDLDVRRALGLARLASGDPAGALSDLEPAVAQRPDASTLTAESSAELALGRPHEARRAAERALALAPRSAPAALAAGRAAAAAGSTREARRYFELTLRLGAGGEAAEARRALKSLKPR